MSEVQRVLSADAAEVETESVGLDDADLVRLYQAMAAARVVDRESVRLHEAGEIPFYVGSGGLEAVAAGAAFALQPGDWLFPSHRDLGMYLLRGGSMRSWFDQLFGNASDLTKGRQMPGHHSLPDGRFVSVSGRVGAQVLQAAGCALAIRGRRDDACVMTSFGEETCEGPDFHAGIHLAARFHLPIVFVCRSQMHALSARIGSTPAPAVRAESYGVASCRVDGADAPAVYRAVRQARESAAGPTLVEAVCDVAALFGDGAPREGRASSPDDPVARLRDYLEQCGAWDTAREEAMATRLRERAHEAVAQARADPAQTVDSLFTDVYADLPWMLEEQGEFLSAGEDD